MTTSDLRFGFNADNEITLGRIAIFGQICGLCRNLQSGKGMLQVPPPILTLTHTPPRHVLDALSLVHQTSRPLQCLLELNCLVTHWAGGMLFGQQLGMATPSAPLALSIVAIFGASLSAATCITFLRYLGGRMTLDELQSFTGFLRIPGSKYVLPNHNFTPCDAIEPKVRLHAIRDPLIIRAATSASQNLATSLAWACVRRRWTARKARRSPSG